MCVHVYFKSMTTLKVFFFLGFKHIFSSCLHLHDFITLNVTSTCKSFTHNTISVHIAHADEDAIHSKVYFEMLDFAKGKGEFLLSFSPHSSQKNEATQQN